RRLGPAVPSLHVALENAWLARLLSPSAPRRKRLSSEGTTEPRHGWHVLVFTYPDGQWIGRHDGGGGGQDRCRERHDNGLRTERAGRARGIPRLRRGRSGRVRVDPRAGPHAMVLQRRLGLPHASFARQRLRSLPPTLRTLGHVADRHVPHVVVDLRRADV